MMAPKEEAANEMIDVRSAAALLRRHPETIRRWVWSGRLVAERHGNRLLIAREDVEAVAVSEGTAQLGLTAWADGARAVREAGGASGSSAAELVLEDRARRPSAG